jgi:peptidoglycan hydrolase-like protein with peptidoglycan-binding domain
MCRLINARLPLDHPVPGPQRMSTVVSRKPAATTKIHAMQDMESFVWIPASKPRRRSGQLAIALLGAACVSPFGHAPLPRSIDAVDYKVVGAEFRPPISTRRALGDHGPVGRPHVERGAAEHILKLSHQISGVRPVTVQSGVSLRPLISDPARRVRAKLSVDENGAYDPVTEMALRAWQAKNGLVADGVAGPSTVMLMGFYDLVLLKRGSDGDAVRRLQQQLAFGVDGRFGPRTEKALPDFQKKNGLVADGMAGPATLTHLLKGISQGN